MSAFSIIHGMRNKNSLVKLKKLLKRPSFSCQEAQNCGVSRVTLARHVQSGEITRLSPGIYCKSNVDIGVDFEWEDMVRLVYQIEDGVICLITALAIYDLTEEISREFWVAIPNDQRAPKIKKVRSIRMRNMDLGVVKKKFGTISLKIFDPERTVVDTFRYLDKEIAIKALRALSQKNMNIRKIKIYSDQLRINIDPYLLMVTT